MSTKELGRLGEDLACEYLVGKGMKILGRNFRVAFGEIDIIAEKKFSFLKGLDRTIHFVEVKTIQHNAGFRPEDHVDARKQQKLRQMAEIWLHQHRYKENHPYQIDVIGVVVAYNGQAPTISHFPNAIGYPSK